MKLNRSAFPLLPWPLFRAGHARQPVEPARLHVLHAGGQVGTYPGRSLEAHGKGGGYPTWPEGSLSLITFAVWHPH